MDKNEFFIFISEKNRPIPNNYQNNFSNSQIITMSIVMNSAPGITIEQFTGLQKKVTELENIVQSMSIAPTSNIRKKKTTPYRLYQKEVFKNLKAENPDLEIGALSAKLSGMWKSLSDAEQAEYSLKASEHNKTVLVNNPPHAVKKSKKKKTGRRNGWNMFYQQYLGEAKKINSTKPVPEIMKEASSFWNDKTVEEKGEWKKKADDWNASLPSSPEDSGESSGEETPVEKVTTSPKGKAKASPAKKEKKEKKPKKEKSSRPRTPYNMFVSEMQATLATSHPNLTPTQRMTEIGIKWKEVKGNGTLSTWEEKAETYNKENGLEKSTKTKTSQEKKPTPTPAPTPPLVTEEPVEDVAGPSGVGTTEVVEPVRSKFEDVFGDESDLSE